jgi:hypothetical protein
VEEQVELAENALEYFRKKVRAKILLFFIETTVTIVGGVILMS